MALATSLNLNASATNKQIAVPHLSGTFVPTSTTATEVVYTDTQTPVDRPRRIRLAFNPIANIYRGSGVDPGFQYASKRGVSTLIQSTSVASVEDPDDPSVRIDLPISMHTVLRLPSTNYLSGNNLVTLLYAHISDIACWGAGTAAGEQVDDLASTLQARIRGSLALDINA